MTDKLNEMETCAKATSILVFIACVMTLGVGVMGIWTYAATHDLKRDIEFNRAERNTQIKTIEARFERLLSECK